MTCNNSIFKLKLHETFLVASLAPKGPQITHQKVSNNCCIFFTKKILSVLKIVHNRSAPYSISISADIIRMGILQYRAKMRIKLLTWYRTRNLIQDRTI